jgi:hypothetical protein
MLILFPAENPSLSKEVNPVLLVASASVEFGLNSCCTPLIIS